MNWTNMMSSKGQIYAMKIVDFISKTEGPVYFEQAYIYIWSCSSFNPLRAKPDILCKTVLLHIPIHFEQPISPFPYIMIYNINKPNSELAARDHSHYLR